MMVQCTVQNSPGTTLVLNNIGLGVSNELFTVNMSKLFDENSDSEIEIKTNNEYAKNYDVWRKKEELHKLEAKYGKDAIPSDEGDSSSSSDDEVEFPKNMDKKFFLTLAMLKSNDPRIYDKDFKFFDDESAQEPGKKDKKKKDKPMTIKDYERNIILEHGGKFTAEDDEEEQETTSKRPRSPTYIEQQEQLKREFKMKELEEDSDDDNFLSFKQSKNSKEEDDGEEGENSESLDNTDLKDYLAGRKKSIKDSETAAALEPLRAYWNDPNLPENERFLRDYILSNKYGEEGDGDVSNVHVPLDLSEEEEILEKQEEFERKFNFRFEEPDQEFIKRYPRQMEHSVRQTDDRRKQKRAELKERKKREKEEKFRDLQKLQELKRQEIEEKIEKLKEVTGADLNFDDKDFEEDFDPESHDKKMQALFNEEFYQGPEGDRKPEFPEFDDYLEIENWDKWHENRPNETEDFKEEAEDELDDQEENVPHCEDENFNMDCDYDPQAEVKKELLESTTRKGKKKRKRKHLFAKVLAQPRPTFDPSNAAFAEYMDEYYKYECEDIIDDIPCKFKYRDVVPNNYGLSVEEVLSAQDRELNKWYSLKKALQIKKDEIEEYDKKIYERKGQNLDLKKKILPSLFKSEQEEKDGGDTEQSKKAKTETGDNALSKKQLKNAKTERHENGQKHKNVDATDSQNAADDVAENKVGNLGKTTAIEPATSDQQNVEQSKKRKKKKKQSPTNVADKDGESNKNADVQSDSAEIEPPYTVDVKNDSKNNRKRKRLASNVSDKDSKSSVSDSIQDKSREVDNHVANVDGKKRRKNSTQDVLNKDNQSSKNDSCASELNGHVASNDSKPKKKRNRRKKKKAPGLLGTSQSDPDNLGASANNTGAKTNDSSVKKNDLKKKKKNKKRKKNKTFGDKLSTPAKETSDINGVSETNGSVKKSDSNKRKLDFSAGGAPAVPNKKFKKTNKSKDGGQKTDKTSNLGLSDARLSAYGINPKKFKNKMKYAPKSS